tara:strand:- start:1257 stop:1673 length:417 start_codon:yes stop_codon:yes gene_type:complete
MFKFLNKNKKKDSDDEIFIKTAALLIHAAKIDQSYQLEEKNIIKKTIISLGVSEENSDSLISKAEKYESNENQILEFTREIKKTSQDYKIKIIESLWHIIYSDGNADMYENSLMRRLSGLIYLDEKIVGEIKKKIKSN